MSDRDEPGLVAIQAILRGFESGKADQVLAACDPDVTFEFPFLGMTVERPDFERKVHGTTRLMQGLKFTDLVIEPLQAPNTYLARYRGQAVVATTGREYRQRYISRVELKEGKVWRFAEHFDTLAFQEAFRS